MKTGRLIAELRIKNNMTQEQLAAELFVSRDLVSKWETGKRRPNHQTIQKIAEMFSVETDEITEIPSFLQELSECIPSSCSIQDPDIKDVLNHFLASLSERDRNVFIRRYYFLDETSEIASEYGLKEAHVRTILMRTRKKLKRFFKEV